MKALLVLVTAVAVNLPINAGVLWFACWEFDLALGYWPAFRIVTIIFLVGWPVLGLALLTLRPFTSSPPRKLVRYILPPLGIVVPFTILKVALSAPWWPTLGVFVVWRVLTLLHVGPTWLLIRPYVLTAAFRSESARNDPGALTAR